MTNTHSEYPRLNVWHLLSKLSRGNGACPTEFLLQARSNTNEPFVGIGSVERKIPMIITKGQWNLSFSAALTTHETYETSYNKFQPFSTPVHPSVTPTSSNHSIASTLIRAPCFPASSVAKRFRSGRFRFITESLGWFQDFDLQVLIKPI